MTLFGFLMIYPFIYILIYSLNDGKDSMMGALYFFPRKFTLDNYAQVFDNKQIWQAYKITILRTVTGTVLHVLFMHADGLCFIEKNAAGTHLLYFLHLFADHLQRRVHSLFHYAPKAST
ncbi:hypothetical protein VQ056_12725 [Paenibacillus sp. JTLBN-2024]